MTAVLSPERQISLPSEICERLNLVPGQALEVSVEDDHSISITTLPSEGDLSFLDYIKACPHPLEIPPREKEDTEPLDLS